MSWGLGCPAEGTLLGEAQVQGKTESKEERMCPGGGVSPREEACLGGRAGVSWAGRAHGWKGSNIVAASFSPGLHSAGFTCVQVPDISGWVNKELKLRQH